MPAGRMLKRNGVIARHRNARKLSDRQLPAWSGRVLLRQEQQFTAPRRMHEGFFVPSLRLRKNR
jgi:hypothetical protein